MALQQTTLHEGLGAIPLEDGRCLFRVWAPNVDKVEVHIVAPFDRYYTASRSEASTAPSGAVAAAAARAADHQATRAASESGERVIPNVSEGSGGWAGAKNDREGRLDARGDKPRPSGAAAASAAGAAEHQATRSAKESRDRVIPNVSEGSGGWAGAKNDREGRRDARGDKPRPSGAAAASAARVCDNSGYHEVVIDNLPPGARYKLCLDGREERPDPASRLQPEGVHGVSEIVPRDFAWHDAQWRGLPLEAYVLYELHVGTFTPQGTFDAVVERLDELKELGVSAIELLPIAQFPGTRNWGYDGVQPYAAQYSYGGPLALKRLVDACHARGLALVLDVVYNHLGPEGNYLAEFGPYFTDRYKTPWGLALNFDGPQSDHVRRFFVENALMWIDEFHVDALRVDAVHAIVDHSAQPFLQDLCSAVRQRSQLLGRRVFSIAESDLNTPLVLLPPAVCGLGFDTQWNDDFHHSLHALLTGETLGYYADYGRVSDLASVFANGYLFTGQYSKFRQRRYGAPPDRTEGEKFIVSAQNHDQVGNRMHGDRLSSMLTFDQLKLSAGALILSPFLPMLFMGEEYGETAPFQYFTSHSDHDLIEAVRKGRHEEFEAFTWQGEAPDPHDEQTFQRSKLNWHLWKQKNPSASEERGAAAASAAGQGDRETTGVSTESRDRVIPNVSEGSGGWVGAKNDREEPGESTRGSSPSTLGISRKPVSALDPRGDKSAAKNEREDAGAGTNQNHHARLRALHRELLRLRRELQPLSTLDLSLVETKADEEAKTLALHRRSRDGSQQAWIAFNFSDQRRVVNPPDGSWTLLLDSNETRWGGTGADVADRAAGSEDALAPASFRLYVKG